jgi:hypothetical protein
MRRAYAHHQTREPTLKRKRTEQNPGTILACGCGKKHWLQRALAMAQIVARNVLPRWPALRHWAPPVLGPALLATLFLVIATLAGSGPSLSDWLGDTDDAVRLTTVRELLGGAPWFDTTLPRIGAPEPLVSHWSRLIDLPLAALIGGLTPLLGADRAELATRIVWPTLLFFFLALIVARDAERRAGPVSAAFTLALVATSAGALAQFRPGRIDHHNAQILCAVGGLLLLTRSLDDNRAGWSAGFLLGLGLAIGYEAIALVVPALGLGVLAATLKPRQRKTLLGDGAARAALAAALTLAAAFIATVPPTHWLQIRCDALSLNLVLFAALAVGGVWAGMAAGPKTFIRLALLAAGLGVGAICYSLLEPACLAGPFGQLSPALKVLWLDNVMETRSIVWLGSQHPAPALATVAFVLAGAAAQVTLWRRRGDIGSALGAVFVLLAVALGCTQIKLMPYACWLAAVALAQWAAQLGERASLSPAVVRIAAVVLLSQAALNMAFSAAFSALAAPFERPGGPSAAGQTGDPHRPCFQSANVRRLAALPRGLLAGDIDLGPYIVALTPHRVVAAPYHRLAEGILANHAILDGAPAGAQRVLSKLHVDYVALCADRSETAPGNPITLRYQLLAGEQTRPLQALSLQALSLQALSLQEVDLGTRESIRIWKILPGP